MKIWVKRFYCGKKATFGIFRIDGKTISFTLEDVYRKDKIPKETRIPAGRYPLSLADWGDMNARYHSNFPGVHKGMIMINNVPNYTGILLHMGIGNEHTEGCICVGDGPIIVTERLTETRNAYMRVYKIIAPELVKKTPLFIDIIDEG